MLRVEPITFLALLDICTLLINSVKGFLVIKFRSLTHLHKHAQALEFSITNSS